MSELTYEKIKEAMDLLPPKEDGLFTSPFNSLGLGLPIFEIPDDIRPVIELSEDVVVSDEFRRECNKFYLDIFGTKDYTTIDKGIAWRMPNMLVMRKSDSLLLAASLA
jgi:hypothetical protein